MIANVATVTREEAQDLLRASDRTLRRLIETGAIRAIDGPRGERLLDRDDVVRCARARDAAITQDEAAALLGISITSVGRMVRSGRLDSVATPGGKRRILRASVEAELATRGETARTRQEPAKTRHDDEEPATTRHDRFVTGQDTSAPADAPGADDGLLADDDIASAPGEDDDAYVPLDAGPALAAPTHIPGRRPRRWRVLAAAVAVAAVAAASTAIVANRLVTASDAETLAAAASPPPAIATPVASTPSGTPADTTGQQPVAILRPSARTRHADKTGQARPARPKKRKPAATKPDTASPAPTPTPPAASDDAVAPPAPVDDGDSGNGGAGGGDTGSVCSDLYGSVGIC